MEKFDGILEVIWLGNTVKAYLMSLAVIAGGNLLLWIADKVALKKLKELADKSVNTADDFIVASAQKCLMPVLYAGVIILAVNRLDFGPKAAQFFKTAWIITATFFALKFISSLAGELVTAVIAQKGKDESKVKNIKGLTVILKGVIWTLGVILMLDNLGYKVSTVLAGLGIGGIAVALAAQAVLGDLFSYISILFDKPFETGDFIVVGELMGTVENIGIKTTRLRSIDGEELILSNSDLTGSRVKNFKRMNSRRVVLPVGVVYGLPEEKLKKIPSLMKGIIEGVKNVRFERSHLKGFGNSSVDFETVYHVDSGDYNVLMDRQQEINLKIYSAFEKEGVEMAFPTQTVYVKKS